MPSKESRYRAVIRTAARGLWTGVFSFDQSFENMILAVEKFIPMAWAEGARECGVLPNELTPAERMERNQAVFSEINHVSGFLEFVEDNRRGVGLLRNVFRRVELWVARYLDVTNRARVLACADKKLKWIIDPAKDNCVTCLRLNGKVKRGSFWRKKGIHPQNPPNPLLECKGWLCGCSLNPTNEPASRGPLPRVP